MKYYRGFVREELEALKLDNTDVDLLRWFLDFKETGKMETKMELGVLYYWVNMQYVIDQFGTIIPVKTADAMGRRFAKMVKAGLLERIIQKIQGGTRVYYRINPSVYSRLLGEDAQFDLFSFDFDELAALGEHTDIKPGVKRSNQRSEGSFCAPHTDLKPGDTRIQIRVKDSVVSDIYLIVTEARENPKFEKIFNDFCTVDDSEGRKRTLYWVLHNAVTHRCSLNDIMKALKATNDKGKSGNIAYYTGILRNISTNREAHIYPAGKPLEFQIHEYLSSRLSSYQSFSDNVHHWRYDHGKGVVTVEFYPDDHDAVMAVSEILQQIVTKEIMNEYRTVIRFEFTVKEGSKDGYRAVS